MTAAGAPPFSYQWRKNGADLTNGGNISGATTNTLTLTNVSWLDAGGYSVVVSKGAGNSVTSVVAMLSRSRPGHNSAARQPDECRRDNRHVQRRGGGHARRDVPVEA